MQQQKHNFLYNPLIYLLLVCPQSRNHSLDPCNPSDFSSYLFFKPEIQECYTQPFKVQKYPNSGIFRHSFFLNSFLERRFLGRLISQGNYRTSVRKLIITKTKAAAMLDIKPVHTDFTVYRYFYSYGQAVKLCLFIGELLISIRGLFWTYYDENRVTCTYRGNNDFVKMLSVQ